MVRFLVVFFCCFPLLASLNAQTSAETAAQHQRLKAGQQRRQLMSDSWVSEISFRSIGPTVFGGRIVDIDVSPNDPTHFFVAYASGGLWLTTNNGTTFQPIFEKEAVMTIGALAVNWQDSLIWVGTGEVNSSRSSYAGVGVYLSEDWGKTWVHRGLEETHHIGRILLDPADPNTAWVAALGHLYTSNPERGIFKTSDGGNSWSRTLFVDDNSGAIDLISDPLQPSTLYAATWERTRRAWDFQGSGAGSGIYKSTDAGDTWKLLTTADCGFPNGEGVGRIGLAAGMENGNSILFAILDNNFRRPKEDEQEAEKTFTKDHFRRMDSLAFLDLDSDRLNSFLRENRFPKKYTSETVKAMIRKGSITPASLADYLEDANSQLFDTPVIGAEVYRSTDGGLNWEKMHADYLDGLYYTYGYYFGQIRVRPEQPNNIYIMGVPVLKSTDGGKTFSSINGENVHADHHALWVNPTRSGHLILGNDGGINISYDDGETWIKCNSPAVGQFYAVAVDGKKPYRVYGGLQDNGVWRGPSTYRAGSRWHATGSYPYQSLMGGDGMQVAIDSRDNETTYTGYQFGNYYRIEPNGKTEYITPQHELGSRPYRWNWQTPIHLSIHNQDILYIGAERLFRSFDQGDHFEAISADLTQGGKKGNVPFGTLTTIHESPLRFGLLYTGSDDGYLHCSPDGGLHWDRISDSLPQNLWVTRVLASQYEESRVYVSLNGYRNDHFSAYIFRSDDQGKNWVRLGKNLPDEPVNVIREDPENPFILYVGTDHGLYISFDQGITFMGMGDNLPAVAIHDLVVHPEARELLLGTHGRSLYLADVGLVQQLNAELLQKNLHLFPLDEIQFSSRWGSRTAPWRAYYEPETTFSFFQKTASTIKWSVQTEQGTILKEAETQKGKGIQFITYNLEITDEVAEKLHKELKKEKDSATIEKWEKGDNGRWYLPAGTYSLILESNGQLEKGQLQIINK